MKFIRTQDNIYQVYKETDGWYYVDRELTVIIYKDEVISETFNMIDILCDKFILVNKDNTMIRIWEYTYKELEEISSKIQAIWTIYGAIWTTWGLKYVAKINEKGKLELI